MRLSPDDLLALASDATDGCRLRIAQALRDQDDPRCEFIEVHCALARAGKAADTGALRTREAQLLAEHQTSWLAEVGLVPGEAVFARGFVDQVAVDVNRAHGLYARLVSREPIRELRLQVDLGGSEEDLPRVLAEIREAGLGLSLEQLIIDRRKYWEVIEGDVLEIRRQGQETVGLSLRIQDFERPASGLDLLSIALSPPDTTRLETLHIDITGRGPNPTEALTQALRRAGPRPSLREWTMGFSSNTGREWIRWVRLSSLRELLELYPCLQTLVLPMAELQAERIEHLELRELFLHWLGLTPCGPADLRQWEKSPVPKGDGLRFLRDAQLPKLERLGIDFQYEWYVGWTPEDVMPLFQSEGLPSLRHLELRWCSFGETLCHELVRARLSRQLEVLDLTGTELADDGAQTLARHRDAFPRLKQLVCGRVHESDAAWNALAELYPLVEPR
ncbi:hypothetical protein ACLESO_00050 [Pyxidicoccus sp. 3LG]